MIKIFSKTFIHEFQFLLERYWALFSEFYLIFASVLTWIHLDSLILLSSKSTFLLKIDQVCQFNFLVSSAKSTFAIAWFRNANLSFLISKWKTMISPSFFAKNVIVNQIYNSHIGSNEIMLAVPSENIYFEWM